MSFAHATLKTVPLITWEEVGDPSPPPSRLSLAAFPPPPLAGGGQGSLAALRRRRRRGRGERGEEIWDPEVRGQGSSPDYGSIEEVSDSQAST